MDSSEQIIITGEAADFNAAIDEAASAAEAGSARIDAAFDTAGEGASTAATEVSSRFTSAAETASSAVEAASAKMDASFEETAAAASATADKVGASSAEAAEEMSASTAAAGDGMVEDLGAAGMAGGAALHDGVTEGTASVADEVGKTGEDAGAALTDGVTASTGEMADELSSAGLLAGGGLASGVKDGTEDLESDLAEKGESSGEALAEGAEKGEGGGIKGLLSSVGVPDALLSGWGELATGIGAVSAVSIDLAEKMQSADTAIANSAGISTGAAKAIGTSFLHMGGEFDGKEIATAFAQVAGQMKSAQGAALTTAQSTAFMGAAATLATAKQASLGSTTSTLAGVMQAFSLKTKDAATASDVLFESSNATGQSVTSVGNALDKVKTKLGGLAPSLATLSGLLVDMTNHGETGRAAMSSLTTAFTAFLKPAATSAKAQDDLNVATKDLTPTLAAYAKQVQAGTLAGTALSKITSTMTAKQAALWATFTSSNTAVNTSAQALQKMGINALTTTGKLRPLKTIIGQLHTQIAGMSTAQATAQLTADGFGSSASKLVKVIEAGPAAFDKSTVAVTKMGSAHAAAAKQGATLDVEFKTMKSTLDDWLTELGQVALPVLDDFMSALGKVGHDIGDVINWFKKMSDPALAIAAVIGGVLVPVIISWGVNTAIQAEKSVVAWGKAMVAAITSGDAQVVSAEGVATAVDASAADQDAAFLTTSVAAIASVAKQVVAFAGTAAGWVATGAEAVAGAAVQVGAWVAAAAAATAAFIAENAASLGIVAGVAAIVAGVIWMATHWSETWGAVKAVAEDVWHFLDGIWHDIVNDAQSIWGGLLTFIESVPTKIKDVFADALSWLLDAGKDILKGLENGIEDGVGAVVGAVKHVGSTVVDTLKDVLSIFSPSAITYTHGLMVDRGLADGMLAGVGAVSAASKTAAAAALAPFADLKTGPLGISGATSVARQVAAGGTSNPAAIAGSSAGVGGGGGGTVHLQITVNNNGSLTNAQQLANELAPLIANPLRTQLLRTKRSLGGPVRTTTGLGLA